MVARARGSRRDQKSLCASYTHFGRANGTGAWGPLHDKPFSHAADVSGDVGVDDGLSLSEAMQVVKWTENYLSIDLREYKLS